VLAALLRRQAPSNRGPRPAILLCALTALLLASYLLPAPPTPAAMAAAGLATYPTSALAALWAATASPKASFIEAHT
jgi:hypothetical protein